MSPTTPSSAGSALSGPEKQKDIEEILNKLELDLEKPNILPPKRNEILERLKGHTTAVEDLDPLLTKRGVSILCRHGFDGVSPTTGRIAMRCLCNVMLFSEKCRQYFVDENYPKEAAERMKVDNREDELLCSRLLFLCTYETDLDFDPMFEKDHIAETININLQRHSKLFTKTGGKSLPTPITVSACNETLKLLYNLTNFYQHHAPLFSKSLLPILKMLKNVPINSPPLQPPVSSLIHALIHLDLEDKKTRNLQMQQNPLFPIFDGNINVDRLAEILEKALGAYSDEEMDKYGAPLVQVLLRISEFAPAGPKSHMRSLLLPSEKDRERILGQGDSMPARLLRLSAAPMAPHLRQHIPALLFELSEKDARRFVRNVGYGFAAGFLASSGVQIPASAMEAWSTGDTDGESSTTATDPSRSGSKAEAAGADGDLEIDEVEAGSSSAGSARKAAINPITGQLKDFEPRINDPNMTDEEKLREAERLFVLFERLRATGVVDVENPVTQALREGRLEELE